MPIAVLMPTLDSAAIGERYVSSRVRAVLALQADELRIYHPSERAAEVAAEIESPHVLVVTDPLMVPPAGLAERLLAVLERSPAAAALPSTNIAQNPAQRQTTAPYVTLRELALATSRLEQATPAVTSGTWDGSDPVAYVCPTQLLDEDRRPLRNVLERQEVVVSGNDYVHRWIEESTARLELLRLIPPAARNILEIGCGDGFLGETVKQRQKCRYVGIESDPQHAAAARRRVDEIYRGDPEELVSILNEKFDCIIAGDAWQVPAESWSFLASLHRLTAPKGTLVTSVTNASNASIVNDLLHGESSFICAGSAAAAAARPLTHSAFTRLLAAAGWQVANVVSTAAPNIEGHSELLARLRDANEYALNELHPIRYHALATSGAGAG